MNKRMVLILFSLLTLIAGIAKAQPIKVGFRVEPALLFIEDKKETSISFSPYSLYLITSFEPVDWLALEARPGLFLADSEYSGFEIGAFVKATILPTKFYIVAGLNNHSNGSSGHNSGGSYAKQMLYKGIGIGYQKDSKLSFDLMYYWTSNKDFAYTFDAVNSLRYNKQMNGILKLGFSLAWDIL